MQEMARDFAMNKVLPVANELDPEKGEIPRELIDKMGEMGYFGITIPEEKGGEVAGKLVVIDEDRDTGRKLRIDCTKFGSGAYSIPAVLNVRPTDPSNGAGVSPDLTNTGARNATGFWPE